MARMASVGLNCFISEAQELGMASVEIGEVVLKRRDLGFWMI